MFFATFPTGTPEIPRVSVSYGTLRADDGREFRVETGNFGGSPRPDLTYSARWRHPWIGLGMSEWKTSEITEIKAKNKDKH